MKQYNEITQGTDEWFHIRKGKITGTTLKAIMGTSEARKKAFYKTIGERLQIGLEEDETDIERGKRLEPEARSMFEFETGLKVEITGFIQSDENEHSGYSPDGLIADTSGTEDFEAKCMATQNHTMLWLTNEIPKEYFWQVVQAFIVNPKLQKRYFVGYNPRIPTHPLHIIEVNRAELIEEINHARNAQEVFLKEVEESLSKIIKL